MMLIAALLPAVLLLLYIWNKDTQKEPTYMLIKAVTWGIGIIIPVSKYITFCFFRPIFAKKFGSFGENIYICRR